jgi:prepilin-type N-terminal cleavage/methylation domain-containing protein
MKKSFLSRCGFSLIEVLASVAIIGILIFLAIPNVIQARMDAEQELAIARAESVNMAVSQFMQAKGRASAGALWTSAATDVDKYGLIKGYLAYAPATLAAHTPSGYKIEFAASIETKVGLFPYPGNIKGAAITY